MYLLLILFFISLGGIILMIGRKLAMLENGETLPHKEAFSGPEYLEELKHATIRNIKRHGYVGLVATIRLYVQFSNFIKNKYEETKSRMEKVRADKTDGSPEANNFLKMISEYKQKIREIKHRIKEEEENS